MTRFRYLLGLFFFAGPAFAYLLSQWTPQGDAPVMWDFDTQEPSAYFDGGKLVYRFITSGSYALADADRQQNIVNAFQTWEDVPDAIVAFTRGPDIIVDDDTDFSIGYSTAAGLTQWGSNMNGAAGLATTTFDGNDHITDADIAFDVNTAWGDELEPTALHEIGHTLAFKHSPDAQSTMSYIGPRGGTHDEIIGRRLSSDDILAIAFNYPSPGYLAGVGSISGTIKVSGADIHQGQIGVFDSADILVATTLSRLGAYKVEGLAPGSYTLRAFPSQATAYLNQQAATLPWREGLTYDDGGATMLYPAATQFLPGSDQSITVTAGNTATLNLSMATGTPTMSASWGFRDISGAFSVKTNVFAMDRGEVTATLGIDGPSLPTQASEVSLFALSGPADITLSEQAFPGWPTGATATRIDASGTFVIPPGPRWFLIRYSSSLSSIYTFRIGYNLISFPYQPDGNAREIFIQDGVAQDLGDLTYVMGGQDHLAGQVEAYRGYWLFTPRREIVRVEGIPAPRTLSIAPGYNSIGTDVEIQPSWTLRSRIHFWSYGYRKTLRLTPQRGYLADFADSELTW